MDLFMTLAACAALASGNPVDPAVKVDPEICAATTEQYQAQLEKITLDKADRDAIGRVVYAEAANQGDAGLAGVVNTILNRLISGDWGNTVSEVVNAPHQFEPVHAAGGWEKLPALAKADQARIDTIINLMLDGFLPDPTNGALYFQNPEIVASREEAGQVSQGLTHFGGALPSSTIKDHAFYPAIKTGKRATPPKPKKQMTVASWDVYGQAEALKANTDSPIGISTIDNTQQSWDVYGQADQFHAEEQ